MRLKTMYYQTCVFNHCWFDKFRKIMNIHSVNYLKQLPNTLTLITCQKIWLFSTSIYAINRIYDLGFFIFLSKLLDCELVYPVVYIHCKLLHCKHVYPVVYIHCKCVSTCLTAQWPAQPLYPNTLLEMF